MMMVEVGWLGSNTWHNHCVNNFLTIKRKKEKTERRDGSLRQITIRTRKSGKREGNKSTSASTGSFRSCQQKQSEFLSSI